MKKEPLQAPFSNKSSVNSFSQFSGRRHRITFRHINIRMTGKSRHCAYISSGSNQPPRKRMPQGVGVRPKLG
jgi:hypothetical protein